MIVSVGSILKASSNAGSLYCCSQTLFPEDWMLFHSSNSPSNGTRRGGHSSPAVAILHCPTVLHGIWELLWFWGRDLAWARREAGCRILGSQTPLRCLPYTQWTWVWHEASNMVTFSLSPQHYQGNSWVNPWASPSVAQFPPKECWGLMAPIEVCGHLTVKGLAPDLFSTFNSYSSFISFFFFLVASFLKKKITFSTDTPEIFKIWMT